MRHILLDIPIDDISDIELDQKLIAWVNGTESRFITTPNPEFILLSRRDDVFKSILQKSDLSIPDGVGLRFAIAALTDQTLTNRQTGVDIVERLIKISSDFHKHIVIIDGLEQSGEKIKSKIEQMFWKIHLSIFNPGKIESTITDTIIDQLRDLNPEILLVCLGQRKQEKFIQEILPNIPSIRIAVGVGGAIDMLSGLKPRAPILLRRLGLEWFWRLLIEPRRFNRIFQAVFVFPLIVISCTLKQHRFIKSLRRVLPEIYRQLTGI